jgi:hypothetical protein
MQVRKQELVIRKNIEDKVVKDNRKLPVPPGSADQRVDKQQLRSDLVKSLNYKENCRVMLQHKDPGVRYLAIYSLGNMGENAKDVIPYLIKRLNDEEICVRNITSVALRLIGTTAALYAIKDFKRQDIHYDFGIWDGKQIDFGTHTRLRTENDREYTEYRIEEIAVNRFIYNSLNVEDFRKEFISYQNIKYLEYITTDIIRNGMNNPIVISEQDWNNDIYKVHDGRHRLIAYRYIGKEKIKCKIVAPERLTGDRQNEFKKY